MRRILVAGILTVALALCVTAASADPWPSLSAMERTVDYVHVVPVFNAGTNVWTFQLSVDPGAVDPIYGALLDDSGVKALVVYQDVGGALAPDYYSDSRPGWNQNGGWEPGKGAFGWIGDGPSSYVHPGDTDSTNFWAHWNGSAPAADDFTYMVHVDIRNAESESLWTGWVGLGTPVIPEPASILLLAAGGLSLFGLRRRK